eukprot:gene6123-10132_t
MDDLSLDIRSQRLSDTYPIRQRIQDKSFGFLSKLYAKFLAYYILNPMINILFPRILNNSRILSLFGFRPSTQVKLLCEWTCADGHICTYKEGHKGKHLCIFGHAENKKILKCKSICDCRGCEADCVFEPGHSGIHKCYFRHYPSDIPSTMIQKESFQNEKSIGDYIDELAYITPEDMKFSHIPKCVKEKDENWFEP